MNLLEQKYYDHIRKQLNCELAEAESPLCFDEILNDDISARVYLGIRQLINHQITLECKSNIYYQGHPRTIINALCRCLPEDVKKLDFPELKEAMIYFWRRYHYLVK